MRRWLEDAGTLGLAPDQFWKVTLAEWMARVAGWNRAQSGGVEPMSRERLEELVAEYGAPSYSIKKRKT